MYYAADKDDAYLSLMTAASCQEFYDEMYSEFDIGRIDLMKNTTVENLTLSAEAFDDAMEEYKKNYDKLGIKINCYKDLGEFERKYLVHDGFNT